LAMTLICGHCEPRSGAAIFHGREGRVSGLEPERLFR
jgi:hypothetical protein